MIWCKSRILFKQSVQDLLNFFWELRDCDWEILWKVTSSLLAISFIFCFSCSFWRKLRKCMSLNSEALFSACSVVACNAQITGNILSIQRFNIMSSATTCSHCCNWPLTLKKKVFWTEHLNETWSQHQCKETNGRKQLTFYCNFHFLLPGYLHCQFLTAMTVNFNLNIAYTRLVTWISNCLQSCSSSKNSLNW